MAAERSAAAAVQNLEAAEAGKVDPMKQFTIEPILGSDWQLADGINIAFTNSALWMAITAILVWVFVAGGMKRQLVPGRWQMAVESMTGFIDDLLEANVGAAGRKYVPYIFTLFMFILFGNLLGLVPVGLIPGVHAFTFTSHFTVTGVLAIMSFSIVLIVGFAKHGFHFFSLFWPSNTPAFLALPISLIELVSFMVRPFSLALRLFVAMMAGHVLLKVLASFVIAGGSGGIGTGVLVGVPSFVLMVAISALEILVAGIQAYVFALLTSLYINDAENLH
ncbi:F0F1 ATP synthase subunit A [Porphyrobacter sp. SLTP]|uniref:F0F1 ATP synthase subunit A n=1 Tax=Porphyrobacter sp. SLTP TaxID=2683266 RepID=UPI00141350B1|nr:F0F1 ATP synthase subunit A [Porphyrobacter sp. SLTP]NBB26004.1 F0F1 ATP synthase subunit A [Porphyrobacter sp. SLTP]